MTETPPETWREALSQAFLASLVGLAMGVLLLAPAATIGDRYVPGLPLREGKWLPGNLAEDLALYTVACAALGGLFYFPLLTLCTTVYAWSRPRRLALRKTISHLLVTPYATLFILVTIFVITGTLGIDSGKMLALTTWAALVSTEAALLTIDILQRRRRIRASS